MGKTNAKSKSFDKKVKEIVRMQLSDEIEEKHAITDYADVLMKRTIPSGVVFSGQGNFFNILPEIEQSTTGEAGRAYNIRIGNEINLKSIDLHGYLSYNGSSTIQADLQNAKLAVRVMILRAKEINDGETLFDNMPTDTLIRFGSQAAGSSNGASPYGGYTLDAFREINRDSFAVRYDEVHYLNSPVLLSGSGVDPDVDLAVVPSKLKIFKTRLKFGKNGLKLKYSAQSDVNANNFPYFMVVGYSSMSSSTRPDDNLVRMSMSCVGNYTDA